VAGDRLTWKDARGLLIWIALGIVGALFAFKFYFSAFPEASVDFRVSREEAAGRAQAFLAAAGNDVTAYESTIVFEVDDNAKTYLERELGLTQANRLMSGAVNVWFWDVRFFRPQQEEEFRVQVSPAGRITGYEHKIGESRAGATLERAAALRKAQDFLRTQYGAEMSAWGFLPEESSSEQRPKRLDWAFAWEKQEFRAKDAPYRLYVTIQGDCVGGVKELLKVPEAWQDSYQRLRSSNIFYNQVAMIPYALLLGSALWLGFTLTRRGQARWKGAMKLGVFVAALLLLMQLNEWPITRAAYDTNSSYGSFVARSLVVAVLFAALMALTVLVVLPAGEVLYRASQPERLRLGKAFTVKGVRTKEFFCSSVVGLSLAAAHIGFVVAFYLLGRRFGVWAPQDVNYTNLVSTAFPWISGVAIGVLAATSEEFLFRFFAIPFLARVTRSQILAVILPAFAWSFLHSAYPQEPGYIRGIEVGIIGIVAGVVMLRRGILATLIWHYTVDASLTGLLLLRSESLYFRISGAVVGAAALVPLGVSGLSYLARGRFESSEELENRAMPAPDATLRRTSREAVGPAGRRQYDALSLGKIGFLAACAIVGAVLLIAVRWQRVGDYLRLHINARDAHALADAMLHQRGLRPQSYHAATILVSRMDAEVNEFLRERIGVARLNEIYRDDVPGALWLVRYFRDGQKEEYAVVLGPDGCPYSVHHTLPEEAPGASLTQEQARARAEAFLREAKKADLSTWKLVGVQSEQRPARTDHTLTWQRIQPLDLPRGAASTGDETDHAHVRMEVQVLGDEVTNYRRYIKIPDEWSRKREEQTLPRMLHRVGRFAFFGLLGLAALVFFLAHLRSPVATAVPWRRLTRWAPWGAAGFLTAFVLGDQLPGILLSYETATPLKFVYGEVAIGILLGAGFFFAMFVLLFGLAWFYGAQAFGEECLPTWRGMPAAYYRDALAIGLGGSASVAGLVRLAYLLGKAWQTPPRVLGATLGQDFSAYVPAAQAIGGSVLWGMLATGVIVLAAALVAWRARARLMRLGLFLLTALALVNDWGSGTDFAKQVIVAALFLAAACWGVQWLVRFNLLGYFLVATMVPLCNAAAVLLEQPNSFYRGNGVGVLAVAGLLAGWPLMEWLRTGSRTG
jgi:membrane protease YdiL (CAAX protease family)